MNKRKSVFPKPTVERSIDVDGLSLQKTEVKCFTFTLAQLKRAITADKIFSTEFTRNDALDVFCNLVRRNRLELFGTFDGYKVITNGYGQLKEIRFSHSNPITADEIFNMLERELAKDNLSI